MYVCIWNYKWNYKYKHKYKLGQHLYVLSTSIDLVKREVSMVSEFCRTFKHRVPLAVKGLKPQENCLKVVYNGNRQYRVRDMVLRVISFLSTMSKSNMNNNQPISE